MPKCRCIRALTKFSVVSPENFLGVEEYISVQDQQLRAETVLIPSCIAVSRIPLPF